MATMPNRRKTFSSYISFLPHCPSVQSVLQHSWRTSFKLKTVKHNTAQHSIDKLTDDCCCSADATRPRNKFCRLIKYSLEYIAQSSHARKHAITFCCHTQPHHDHHRLCTHQGASNNPFTHISFYIMHPVYHYSSVVRSLFLYHCINIFTITTNTNVSFYSIIHDKVHQKEQSNNFLYQMF